MIVGWRSPVQGYDEYRLESEDGIALLKLFVTEGDVLEIRFSGVVGWSFVPEFLVGEIPDGAMRSLVRRAVKNWPCAVGEFVNDSGFFLFSTYVPNIGLFDFVAESFQLNEDGVLSDT